MARVCESVSVYVRSSPLADLSSFLLFGRFREQSGHQPAIAEQSRFMSTRPRLAGNLKGGVSS